MLQYYLIRINVATNAKAACTFCAGSLQAVRGRGRISCVIVPRWWWAVIVLGWLGFRELLLVEGLAIPLTVLA
jgi:hypothetical protein